jgi:filamentous hemagglutinin family protein
VSKALSSWFGLSLCILGYFCATNNPALAEARLDLGDETVSEGVGVSFRTSSLLAQVTSDDTVNTQVTENGNTAEITGGETRGDNLFHSFQDFSVETGNEASFLNANDISNIFSRVTGGNISNIDGLINANGSANLFLINPAGIIFGEGASLDIGGSFYGSSASSILFEDGEFSATDLDNPPLLTINAPIGLGFRDQPGDIVNRASTGDGLEVEVGENISLIGGNVSIEDGGIVFAPEGRIELGGLTESGIIGFTKDNNLSFPDAIARGDVSLTDSAIAAVSASVGDMASGQAGNIELHTGSLTVNGSSLSAIGGTQDRGGNITIDATEDVTFANVSFASVTGAEGGSIQLDAKNLSITSGSIFLNGISEDSGFAEAQSGDININVTDNVSVDGQGSESITAINNSVSDNAIGNAGEINIAARNISLNNGGQIQGFVSGEGNSSDITLNARENISINGSNGSFNSGVNSFVQDSGSGNSGTTNITAQNLTLSNGGNISSEVAGVGDSGDININVKDALVVDGEGILSIPSAINSRVGSDAQGNSGDIRINTSKLSLRNGGQINADIFSRGNAGNININSTESITINGIGSQGGNFSGINSSVLPTAEGNAGDIEITTNRLSLTNGGSIDANTSGIGNSGNININSTESITLDGISPLGVGFSGINSLVTSTAEGNAGNIQISTRDFTISNDASVDAGTFGRGNGGEINITATNLSLINGGDISANILGTDGDNIAQGNGGNISINVADTLNINGTSTVEFQGQVVGESPAGIIASNLGNGIGNAGNIDIIASKLSLTNGSQITSFSRGRGDGGNITINAQDSILLDAGNESEVVTGISTDLEEGGVGNAGTINITTNNLNLFDDANILVRSRGEGNSGNIFIQANSLNLNGDSAISAETSFGTGGNIQLQVADGVVLDNNSSISAEATNNANGGNLTIDSNFIVAFPNQNNDIIANASQGQGGKIMIDTESLFGIEERPLNDSTNDINASSEFALDGSININTSDINPVQGATELPSNIVESAQTTAQTCKAGRGTAQNSFAIAGKGGVPPAPDTPLNSENIISSEQNPAAFAVPEPIETSQGKIQPARGIKVSKSGKISLTAYRTNNAGERIPEIKPNCN